MVPSQSGCISFSNHDDAMRYAEMILKSSFCPKSYRTAGDILIAVQFGSEIGLKPMQALQSIAVINGKPSLYGDAALALVRNSGLLESIKEWYETYPDEGRVAICEIKRVGEEIRRAAFSEKMAKKAQLLGKPGPWTTYPERMLMFRARGFALRDAFGDVLGGLISAEEAMDYPKGKNSDIYEEEKIVPNIDLAEKNWHEAFSARGPIQEVLMWCEDGTVDDIGLDFIKGALKIENVSDICSPKFSARIPKLHQWIIDKYVNAKV